MNTKLSNSMSRCVVKPEWTHLQINKQNITLFNLQLQELTAVTPLDIGNFIFSTELTLLSLGRGYTVIFWLGLFAIPIYLFSVDVYPNIRPGGPNLNLTAVSIRPVSSSNGSMFCEKVFFKKGKKTFATPKFLENGNVIHFYFSWLRDS